MSACRVGRGALDPGTHVQVGASRIAVDAAR